MAKHTAELRRKHTDTLFHHVLTPEEVQTLRTNETLLRNMLEHENPGFTVVRIYRGQ